MIICFIKFAFYSAMFICFIFVICLCGGLYFLSSFLTESSAQKNDFQIESKKEYAYENIIYNDNFEIKENNYNSESAHRYNEYEFESTLSNKYIASNKSVSTLTKEFYEALENLKKRTKEQNLYSSKFQKYDYYHQNAKEAFNKAVECHPPLIAAKNKFEEAETAYKNCDSFSKHYIKHKSNCDRTKKSYNEQKDKTLKFISELQNHMRKEI